MRVDKKTPLKADKKVSPRGLKRGAIGYGKKSALLEDAITQMNAGKYGRSSAALKELLTLDPANMEARRLFATLHLRLGSLLPARQAFESLANEAIERQDYWLAESLLREYLAAGPRCVPFIEKLGSVYQEKGDVLAASEEFAKAIDILIEDPDPDRPALPTELYAKIRELAPASPPAFRLASFFDAQTGELIARAAIVPSPSQEEALAQPGAIESSESTGSNLSIAMSDPVFGVMPWDDVSADTSVLPAQSFQSESLGQGASSIAELPTAADASPLADESRAPQDVFIDRAPAELSTDLSFQSSNRDRSSLIVHQDVASAGFSLAQDERPVTTSASPDSESDAVALLTSQDSWNMAQTEAVSVAPAMPSSQSDASSTLLSSTSDALPVPLSWEQVQEATVAIPELGGESPSVGFQSEESVSLVSPEIVPIKVVRSDESGEKQKTEFSLVAGTGITRSLATTEECSPGVAWSASGVVAIEPPSSYSPSPEPRQTISALGESQSDVLAEFVPAPMPWEQIQESPVSIEGFTQESIALAEAAPEPLPTQSQEATSVEVSDRGASEAIASSPEFGSLESRDAVSAPTDGVPSSSEGLAAPEPSPKIGEFSWTSIFNSAWKFGTSSPASEDSLHHSSPGEPPKFVESVLSQEAVGTPILDEEQAPPVSAGATSESMPMPGDQTQDTPSTVPFADSALSAFSEPLEEFTVAPIETSEKIVALEIPGVALVSTDEQTDVAVSEEVSAAMPASVNLAESAVLPMPGDQVPDTLVTISSADSAMDSVVASLAAPPASPVEPVNMRDEAADHDASQVMVSVDVLAVSAHVVIEESPSSETVQGESVEGAFRFTDSNRIEAESTVVSEELRAQPSTLPTESPTDLQPAVCSSLANDRLAVHSQEHRIASQTEPSPVAQESSKPDAAVSSAGATFATAPSPELGSPVLPHELVPVLQTLVDQLSVVTKTISGGSAETKSCELVFRDQADISEAASLREPSKAPSSAELAANPSSAQMPPTEEGFPSQWETGEVAVQTHRPSAKKRKHSIESASEDPDGIPLRDDLSAVPADSVPPLAPAVVEIAGPTPPTVQEKEEWVRTSEAIRFIDPVVAEPVHLMPLSSSLPHDEGSAVFNPSTAASAIDVLFQSSGHHTQAQTTASAAVLKPRLKLSARLARARIGLSAFIGPCFSTTRTLVTSIVGLAVLFVAVVAVAIGAVGLTWLVMEEKPSPAFQRLTLPPQRAMTDSSKNGYLLLLGFEAAATADPVQAGREKKSDTTDGGMAAVCHGEHEGLAGANQKTASASVAQGWYRSADPAGQFRAQTDSLKDWTSQATGSLGRYRQWLKMPFEDWGYDQAVTPPCSAILFAHRLHVAEGFSQGASTEGGVERLESDMEAWRTTLGQAKTLSVKVMALQAINEDIAVASGLLGKPDFDGTALPRLAKMLRPLDPIESSMRWPMQSQLVLATKSYGAQLEANRGEDIPLHVSVASMLPLPKQRRFNDYAEYYESAYKAAGEGRYSAMPKRATYIRHPANGVMDYLTNPIENIIGLDPLPAWDHYNGLVIDTDARLRLASLQAWLRRGPQDADLLARIAKAGQRFYDPYTGLPMLVNFKKGAMYSVGHDGKDQDADPQQDVVVSIPLNQTAAAAAKPTPKSK